MWNVAGCSGSSVSGSGRSGCFTPPLYAMWIYSQQLYSSGTEPGSYHARDMQITFWGAARVVTGSMHLVEVGGRQYLLDCGQYQGRRQEAEQLNRNIPFPAKDLTAAILSHAHIDHSGNLPLLVK